ncbi:HYC_CC_PP family protein [Emticicia fontis]
MKKALFRLFNIMMAVVVLLSSTGFGFVEHSCIVKGKTTSLHKKGDLCCVIKDGKHFPLNNKNAVIKKTSCCTEEEKYENVEYSSSASQLVAKFTQSTLDWFKATVHEMVKTIIETIFKSQNSSLATTTSPPDLNGRAIIITKQSFLI